MLFNKTKVIAIGIIAVLLIISSYSFFSDIEYTQNPDEYYSTNEATTTVHDEYLPVWVKVAPDKRPENKIEVLSGDAVISNMRVNSKIIEFNTEVNTDSVIRVNTIYWPGWRVFVEGQEREISYDNDLGVIEINLKQYDDRVYVSFSEDIIRTLSDTLTIIAALALIYYISRPLIKF